MGDRRSQYCSCSTSKHCTSRMQLHCALVKYFKFDDFREGQLEAMLPVMHGRDVFVRMATGSGKSLCMFLPSLAASDVSMSVIISPLNALMDQQVEILTKIGVPAARVGDNCIQINDVCSGKYRFVFMSPEVATAPPWREVFSSEYLKKHLFMIAIDEAHCITEWGNDFRTAFGKIGGLRALCDSPIMALTATASTETESMISTSLSLSQPVVISQRLNRANIFFSASGIKSLAKDLGGLTSILSSAKHQDDVPKTLIFARTKNKVCQVYSMLSKHAVNSKHVRMFHASMTPSTKKTCVIEFKSGVTRCMVSTIAFGMGIDIPDIELVILYGAPSNVNQLHQLCGRAGRGGCDSRAHVLYSTRPKCKMDDKVRQLCEDRENCRRKKMLEAIGSTESCDGENACCDTCGVDRLVPKLKFEESRPVNTVSRKRRCAVFTVTEDAVSTLAQALRQERDKYLDNHPNFAPFGPDCVCSNSLIDHICMQAKFISEESDLDTFFTLRPALRPIFFKIIQDVFSVVAIPRKSRCVLR